MSRRAPALTALALASCAVHPARPAPTEPARLELHVDARDARAVRVEGRFRNAGSATLALPAETLRGVTRFEVKRRGAWVPLGPGPLVAPECVTDCTLRYTVDLADVERSFEGVVAVGTSAFVAPTPTWLARPEPLPRGVFELTVDGAASPGATFTPVPFATGLRRRGATRYVLPTEDFAEGSYAAFGRLRQRVVQAAGASLDLVVVGDERLALGDEALAAWVAGDAACVAELDGRFPVRRATIFVVPIEGASSVVFGKVLSMGGASLVVLTGTRFPETTVHADWVLVHEMIHLAFPTLGGVRWLSEGLATYYEAVLRTRAGWHTPGWLWSWFLSQMKRGVPGAARGLDHADSIDDTYWGGALFVLLADVGIRERTHGAKSFDDVARAILARGGDATVAWRLSDVLAVARAATGTRVLGELVRRLAVRGERVDLDAVFADLGVQSSGPGGVTLDDAAPDAALRRAIERGKD